MPAALRQRIIDEMVTPRAYEHLGATARHYAARAACAKADDTRVRGYTVKINERAHAYAAHASCARALR